MVLFNLCKHSKLRKTAVPVAGYVTHKEYFFLMQNIGRFGVIVHKNI